MPLTESELQNLEALHAESTPGEWSSQFSFDGATMRKYLRRTYRLRMEG